MALDFIYVLLPALNSVLWLITESRCSFEKMFFARNLIVYLKFWNSFMEDEFKIFESFNLCSWSALCMEFPTSDHEQRNPFWTSWVSSLLFPIFGNVEFLCHECSNFVCSVFLQFPVLVLKSTGVNILTLPFLAENACSFSAIEKPPFLLTYYYLCCLHIISAILARNSLITICVRGVSSKQKFRTVRSRTALSSRPLTPNVADTSKNEIVIAFPTAALLDLGPLVQTEHASVPRSVTVSNEFAIFQYLSASSVSTVDRFWLFCRTILRRSWRLPKKSWMMWKTKKKIC